METHLLTFMRVQQFTFSLPKDEAPSRQLPADAESDCCHFATDAAVITVHAARKTQTNDQIRHV